jgi:hypothetical protein
VKPLAPFSVISGVLITLALVIAVSPGQAQEPPNPIDPDNGEQSLLGVVNSLPLNDIDQALDNYPVPYVVVARHGDTVQISNNKAGVPTNVDVDLSKATGKGGHDIRVEVNTELVPPSLVFTVNRQGVAPFVEDVEILIGFPFDAFNDEDLVLPGDPNVFIGYETTAAGGAVGGIAPLTETFTFVPGMLNGTDHLFTLNMQTTGSSNPLRFLAGTFDGDSTTGVLNAVAMAAHTEPVPATINLAVDVNADALSDPNGIDSFFDVTWTASSASKVTFNYLEEETGVPTASDPSDYGTTLTFDQMPTSEHISLTVDEDFNSITLGHEANAVINAVTLVNKREDGFALTGVMSDVPTEMNLSIDTAGAVTLNVNANTLDLNIEAQRLSGFLDTSAFLGYDLGYLRAGMTDAPDLTGAYNADDDSFRAQAVNAGESIGRIEMVLDEGPISVTDGGADVDADGDVDGDDNGTNSGVDFIDGQVDLDGDGDVDGDDDGLFPASAPSSALVIDGAIDLSGNNIVDDNDDGLLTLLELPPSWNDMPTHHIISLVDDGTFATIAGRLVNLSAGAIDFDSPGVIDGQLDLNNDAVVDGNDDGIVAVERPVIDGRLDTDADGDVDAADDDEEFGRQVIDGGIDLNDDGFVNAADDGAISAQTYGVGTTLASPMQAHLDTADTSVLFPGRDILATCDIDDIPAGDIDFQIVFPPPTINVNYKIDPPQGINQISCIGNVDNVHFELLIQDAPPEFDFDFQPDSHLRVKAEDGTGPNSDNVGAIVLRLCDDPDEDGDCVAGENGLIGLPGTGILLGDVLRDARARADNIPSFLGTWADSSANAIDGRLDMDGDSDVDADDDGKFGSLRIFNGQVDIDGNGVITGADDGRVAGKIVTNGDVDVDHDGDVDASDDGLVAGSGVKFDTGVPDASLFLDGVQFDVSTAVGVPELSPADPTSDHFGRFIDMGAGQEKRLGAGAFGIDEFAYSSDDTGRGVAVNYNANQDHQLLLDFDSAFGGRFFPQFAIDLNLTVDDVPQTWSFFTDLATELVYDGSSNINSITIDGTIDDTDDANDTNGTVVEFDFGPIPAHVAFHLAPNPRPVVDGKLDVKGPAGIDVADDDIYAGVRIIDGGVDINASGGVDASDDGILVGVAVIDGGMDMNRDGAVDGNDDGSLAGAMLRMTAAVPEISFSLTSTNNILGVPLQLIEFSILNIPARWDVNWGGGRFLVEARDTSDFQAAMGSVNARVSTSSDGPTNDAKVLPFTQDGDQLGGPVLGAVGDSGGCRINYSPFTQEVDRRYYSQNASSVFPRLRDLYCDSEQLDPNEDHVLVRLGGPALIDFGSLKVSGFQHISWTPDSNGGQFILRAPTPGLHPLFGGFETGGLFATLQIANIPDEIIVDIDKTAHIHYDATDDADASIIQADAYFGPLPTAGDGDTAIRAVLNFDPGTPEPSSCVTGAASAQCMHLDWNFGFPTGGATFNTSEKIELLLLAQDGNNRITGGLAFEDLHIGYFVDFPSLNGSDFVCLGVPDPTDGCIGIVVPTALSLVEASAGIDNDPADPAIQANFSKPGVGGFFALYEHRGSPGPLSGACDPSPCPGPGGSEYLPLLTFLMADFREFSFSASIEVDPFPENFVVGVPPFSLDIECCDLQIEGDFVFDVWSNVETNETVDIDLGIGEIGFLNHADHTENDPFHIMPGLDDLTNADFNIDHDVVVTFEGFHGFGDHVDPFGP